MHDLLIKDGRVIDGTGSPWRKADIGITDDTITKIGHIPESDAGRLIDANCVCPIMAVRRLLKSCATPPANWPIASSFCDCLS